MRFVGWQVVWRRTTRMKESPVDIRGCFFRSASQLWRLFSLSSGMVHIATPDVRTVLFSSPMWTLFQNWQNAIATCQQWNRKPRLKLRLWKVRVNLVKSEDWENENKVHISFINIPSQQQAYISWIPWFQFFQECFIGNRSKVWRCSCPVILNSWHWQHIVSVLWRRVPWNAIWRKAFRKGIPVDGWSLVNPLIISFVTFYMPGNEGFQLKGV